MKENPLNSYHLFIDRAREALFEVVCSDIEASRGENTIALESLGNVTSSKEICSLEDNFDKLGENSGYSLAIGLKTYSLKYGKNCIGRFEDNDIVIDYKVISRRHCCIVVHSDETMEIFDTASKNGIRVNGRKIQKCKLKSGDEITLARSYTLIISATC